MENNNKQHIILVISLVFLFMLIIAASFTYAYFTADTSGLSNLNVLANVSNAEYPVLTAYSNGSLDLLVTTADMLDSNKGKVASSANQNLYVTLIAGGGNNSETVTCSYDIIWKNSGTSYVKSPNAVSGNLKEYTIQIFNTSNTALSSEIDLYNLSDNSILLGSETISSSGSLSSKTYKVVTKIYNLDVVQNIYNKTYSGIVSISNISC